MWYKQIWFRKINIILYNFERFSSTPQKNTVVLVVNRYYKNLAFKTHGFAAACYNLSYSITTP